MSVLDDEQWLRDHYVTQQLGIGALAKAAGTGSHERVRRALRRHRIPIRMRKIGKPPVPRPRREPRPIKERRVGPKQMPRTYPDLYDPDWLTDMYVTRRMTQRAITDEIGCTPQLVSYVMRRYGIPARHRGGRNAKSPAKK